MQDDTDEPNDGRFPDGSPVLTRYPLTDGQAKGERASWPWLPATVLSQIGPDEWVVVLEAHGAITAEDGTGDALHPIVFRDAGEIQLLSAVQAGIRAVFSPGGER